MPMLRPAHPCIHRDPKRKDVHVISDGTPKHRYVQHATLARHGPSKKHFIQSNQNLIYSAIAALKGQFVGHCYHSIVFSKGPQTFFGNLLG